ncbi:MAG: tRNA (adenosine(37)-N6)-dimethylallyltransferase MiaA [Candidatus Zixiibacteriota bacterium]|nr:MAG: tRNA (adenosine(37)-N6)-dimethylallyltransferase MiaA [candidate division Zixibacteria bacterium]
MAAPEPKAIPVICGPTGSGKTEAALRLARQYPIEIISADSRQIIKYLDIGTAKPSPEERRSVEFHLLDLVEPGETYSAFRFIEDADGAIDTVLARDRIPLVVGGTGLYLRVLTEGVVEIDSDDGSVRERLEKEMEQAGAEAMHAKLKEIDPAEAARIHPNNRLRVIRALEIYRLTGRTKSELTSTGAYRKSSHAFAYCCLMPSRDELYRAIDDRVDRMMAAGLLEELTSLVDRGLKDPVRKANVIGYSELIDYLDGNFSLAEVVSMIKLNSRHYAKRQMTWFRKQSGCVFYETRPRLEQAVAAHCEKLKPAQIKLDSPPGGRLNGTGLAT